MYIHPKLKLQTFRQVAIPRPSQYFARLNGQRISPPSGAYSDEHIPLGNTSDLLRRVELLELEHQRDELLAKEEADRKSEEK